MWILRKIRTFLHKRKRTVSIAEEKRQPLKVEKSAKGGKPGDRLVSISRKSAPKARKRRKG